MYADDLEERNILRRIQFVLALVCTQIIHQGVSELFPRRRGRVYPELFWKIHRIILTSFFFSLLLVGRYFEPLIMWHTELIARRRLW